MNQNNTNRQEMDENKMGYMPVGRLLFSMSLPAIFSMLVLSLYNIVDSIFVSRVSEAALTAVSLAYPLQTLLVAFSVGLSVGICSVVSRRLGEKREDLASTAAQTGYTILLICTVLFMIIGLLFTNAFISLYTNDAELIRMGDSYLSIVLIASLGGFICSFTEKVIQGTGDTIRPMFIQLSGCIFNIIMDPILIFGYFGLPAMGVTGAAIATVMGQFISMFLGLVFIKHNKYLKFNIFKFCLDKKSCADIFQVGLPSVVMQGVGTVMTSLLNAILVSYNILATTVFGVYFKLQSFVFMPVFGLNQGLMPILGFNYGARNKKRMMDALRLALITAFMIMTVGMLIFYLAPDFLLGMFNASEQMLAIGRLALKRISLSFPLAAITIVMGAIFQAIGDGYLSMLTSIVRQIVFLIPLAWLLGKLGGLDMIWYAWLVAEFVAVGLNIFFYSFEKKKWAFEQ